MPSRWIRSRTGVEDLGACATAGAIVGDVTAVVGDVTAVVGDVTAVVGDVIGAAAGTVPMAETRYAGAPSPQPTSTASTASVAAGVWRERFVQPL